MLSLIKPISIFYAFVTLMLFIYYGFWWTISILFFANLFSFVVVVAQIPGAARYYLMGVAIMYLIIYLTVDYWPITDPHIYKAMVFLYMPFGFIVLGGMILDAIKDVFKFFR